MTSFAVLQDHLLFSELLFGPAPIRKQANVFSDMASSIAQSFNEQISPLIKGKDNESRIQTIARFLEAGAFFKIHPLLGVIDAVAQQFGFSLTDTVMHVFRHFVPKIKDGLSPEDIDKEAQPYTVLASKAEIRMLKLAALQSRAGWFGNGRYSESEFQQAFRSLKAGNMKSLVVSLAMWVVKSAFWSAGLLTGAAALTGALGLGKSSPSTDSSESTETAPEGQAAPGQPEERKAQPAPAQGQQLAFQINGSVQDTLIDWAIASYPQLAQYDDLFPKANSFKKTVQELQQYVDRRNPNFIIMPQRYRSKKDVLAQFMPEVIELYKREQ